MSHPLKQLAGETAIYGLSTILARIINFFLVPLYTRILTRSNYGVVTEFMAYIAVLQVILTLGLETGCFNFASKDNIDKKKVFSNAFFTVFGVSALFCCMMIIFATPISNALGYAGYSNCMIYIGGILLMDCSNAIIFAKLRYEHKAMKFAVIKCIKIFTETGMNLVFFLLMPKYFASHPGSWMLHFISATPDFSYVIFAIFVSAIVCTLLLLPEILRLTFKFDKKLWKSLLAYSLPLMIAGLPGIINDFMDRILMRFFNSNPATWRADLGVYQAGVKIAVIMSLFIQMFRYAAEPFFFQRQKNKDYKQMYAKVMDYFVEFCMFIFLGVVLYIDVIGLLLGRDFRIGLSIAPIMLMAYVLLGMNFNISMWYKLSGKTKYALFITLAGMIVTLVVNVIFMPIYSYHAAAWAHVASYAVMMGLSLWLGEKYFPIPYNWNKILVTIFVGLGLYGISTMLPDMRLRWKLLVHTALLLTYVFFWMKFENVTPAKMKDFFKSEKKQDNEIENS
ncbi:MAG: oligosaccharide flippase family protein [Bacteroidales bacterium]|jgi:O-antigen/teichoic acid export membrane protein|nr:oligosaccharide flippase family protein [Bacteroidales bacterium]MCI2122207.1 oligosaccharide flippase family protein [Bacteroidales bacterium]MCI2145781.1 oligosaccharide flippase family protein [Bacteroidales bacterium]